MMGREKKLQNKLIRDFSPSVLEVVNESHMHSGPADAETHFKVTVVTEAFEGKGRVARHQLVYGAVADEFEEGLHALALHTYTEKEWSVRQGSPDSPNCLGGSK